jgi:hypothetical protein
MSDENFNSIKELEDAESNQVFSKVDKPIPMYLILANM